MTTAAAYFLWISLLLAAGLSRNQYAAFFSWCSWVAAGLVATRPEKRPEPTIREIAGILRSRTPTQWKTLMPQLTADQLSAIQAKVAKLASDLDAANKAAGQNAQDNASVAQAQAAVANAQATASASLATANALAQTAQATLADLSSFIDAIVAPPAQNPVPVPTLAAK
jgi:hypothetical protein